MVLLLFSSSVSQLSFFTDEGVQEHFAYLQAFAKAIFYLSVGGKEDVCFKHSKNNTVALSTQFLRYFRFAVKALKPLFGPRGVTLSWLRAPCHARGESLRSRLGLEEGSRNTGSPDSERKREQQHAVKASKK